MKQSFFLLVFIAFNSISCGDTETSLIGQLEVTSMVNPNVGILIKNNNLAVTLTDEQTILGIGSGLIFESHDNFNSFQVSGPFENDLSKVVYMTGNAIICYQPPYNSIYDPFTLYRSTDKGTTWKKSVIQNIDNDYSRGFEILRIQFINDNQGFMLVNNWSYSDPANTLVYKLDLDKSEAVLVGQVDGYLAAEMKFWDANNGYVLLRAYLPNNNMLNAYISRTSDGGAMWSTPSPVDVNNRLSNVELIDSNTIIIFDYSLAYHSVDAGMNWKKIEVSAIVNDMSFINNTTGFSIDGFGAVSKTTNAGLNWTLAGNIVVPGDFGGEFSKINFYNNNVGIVYGRNQLYSTNDGGKSWNILIYPFWYVTGD